MPLYRICRARFGPVAAIYSILLWISLGNVSFAAVDFRPYGLGLFSVIWSAHAFLRWLQIGKTYLVIAHGIATALALYCNYLFGVIVIAQLGFLFVGHFRRWLRVRPILLVSPLLAGLLLLPVVPILRSVAAEAHIHVVSGKPAWTDLGLTWMQPRWVIAAVAATAILALFRPGKLQFRRGGAILAA